MSYELGPLPYEYDFLEPEIDEQTMKIHHDKHHQGYVDKLNKSLEKYPELIDKPLEELIRNIGNISDEIRVSVRNNGGGHLNHTFFWSILNKGSEIGGKEILTEIKQKFGNLEQFKTHFKESATKVFGSGWTWLVLNNNQLEILNTAGHENPISNGMIPLLVIDMWEHAYYLKYQNKKGDYVDNFFNLINWDKVNELFLNGKR